jgi:hypothetical protein
MIMIRKDGPCFQRPLEIVSHSEKAAMQDGQAIGATKMVLFSEGACGDEISSTL